jgi:hypothetical protein
MKRTILAFSLAVTLLAATASSASTTPTPPAPPLTLDVFVRSQQTLGKRGVVRITNVWTNNASTLVARGGVKKTTEQLNALEPTNFKAKLKHLERLKEEPTKPKVKIKFAATDEFGQTATEERKVTLCSRLIFQNHRERCRWQPSR